MANHNIDPNIGKKTQFPHNDPTKGGRKKQWYTTTKEKLKDMGYNPVSKREYHEFLALILELPRARLDELMKDSETPAWITWLLSDLSNKKVRQRIMMDHRDWIYGKATESLTIKPGGGFKGFKFPKKEDEVPKKEDGEANE